MAFSAEGEAREMGSQTLKEGDNSESASCHQESWSAFQQAASTEGYVHAWLDLQCLYIPGTQHGVVVLGPAGKGPYIPIAYWPDEASGGPSLVSAAELAMAERRGVIRKNDQVKPDGGSKSVAVAYPLIVDDLLCGVVAIEFIQDRESGLQSVMRRLQWGCGWLEALVRRKTFASRERVVAVLDLVAIILEQPHFQASATAMATELGNLLDCEWVALGFSSGKHTHVRALSNSAAFEKKTNLHRSIGAAMDEAIEQQTVVTIPSARENDYYTTRAHALLVERVNLGAICTLPLVDRDRAVGALTLSRGSELAFDEETVEFCKHVCALVGPILEVKRKDDRWLISKAWDSAQGLVHKLVGPRYVGLKLGFLLLVSVSAYLSLAQGDYRVTAEASLEGAVQRMVTAPMDSYIDQTFFRAGDLVQAGDILCTLEDKDLRLERAKWASQKEQRLREYSKALSSGDRAQVRILDAQLNQAETQLALLDEQLARTKLKAPFDGIVVSGDLSQSLGVPVTRGDMLFQVAPLNRYRVILVVDERDLSQVAVGQTGRLTLAGLTDESFAMEISKITPVSSAQEGRNIFKVEAALSEASPKLRPGMEGIGKISVDRRSQLWIWSHKLVHWVRYWLWSWWP